MLSDEDKKMRESAVGASEVGMVAGLAPASWGGQMAVYRRLCEGYVRPSDELLEMGNLFEEPIAQLAAKRLGMKLHQGVTLRHRSLDFIVATPDRINEDGEPVEIKFVPFGDRALWGEEASDAVPAHVLSQVNTQCEVLGVKRGFVGAYFGGTDFRTYEVRRDAQLVVMLVGVVTDFWTRHVVPGIPPPLDASVECAAWLSSHYPTHTNDLRPASPEALAWADELRKSRAEKDAAKARFEKAKNELKALIGDSAGIEGIATWRKTKDTEKTDFEAMAAAMARDLAGIGNTNEAEVLKLYAKKFTARKPGHRVFKAHGGSNADE